MPCECDGRHGGLRNRNDQPADGARVRLPGEVLAIVLGVCRNSTRPCEGRGSGSIPGEDILNAGGFSTRGSSMHVAPCNLLAIWLNCQTGKPVHADVFHGGRAVRIGRHACEPTVGRVSQRVRLWGTFPNVPSATGNAGTLGNVPHGRADRCLESMGCAALWTLDCMLDTRPGPRSSRRWRIRAG